MLDAAAYRANETSAKRAIASWRLSNVNDPYVFQNQGFPVRADSFLDLAQILDTMQEERFDYYIRELGGFTEEDTNFFVKVCLDYVDFYTACFQRERVVVPLSTLIAHFVAYRKLIGYNAGFTRLLELGPGCGYLSFFLRHHAPLVDYTQIESTESFYLLQSHINSHVFGSRFAEHALSRLAQQDHGKYIPKLNWHNAFHYEEQKILNVRTEAVCNHFPWWRIGEVARRKYDIVASNANLNEFSREALFQYLSLIRDVLADNGAIVAQCLGGGPPSYDTIFANMKSAGFVPIALIAGGANMDGRVFVVSNGIFVGKKHPLYEQYADVSPQFPLLDRRLSFVDKMYFLNQEQPDRKQIHSTSDMLHAIADQIEVPNQNSGRRIREREFSGGSAALTVNRRLSLKPLHDVNRLRRIARLEDSEPSFSETPEPSWDGARRNNHHADRAEVSALAEVNALKQELAAMRSSRTWRMMEPVRAVSRWARRQLPSLVRWVRWLRTKK